MHEHLGRRHVDGMTDEERGRQSVDVPTHEAATLTKVDELSQTLDSDLTDPMQPLAHVHVPIGELEQYEIEATLAPKALVPSTQVVVNRRTRIRSQVPRELQLASAPRDLPIPPVVDQRQ